MERRTALGLIAGIAASAPIACPATAAPVTRLAAAWRGPADTSPQRVGILSIDWERSTVRIDAQQPVPGRAHGLLAETGGGVLAVAYRGGRWLWRLDAGGDVVRRVSLDDEPGGRRFGGHVVASLDGRTLYATELDARDGSGRIGVRDAATLRKLDDWPSGGIDPHQLLPDAAGRLVVAHGGLLRTADGRKRDVDRMDPSLVVLDGRRGAVVGEWRLPDPRLGLRHLAWSRIEGRDAPLLGIALQAEHDDPVRRAEAPLLALWDGGALSLPSPVGAGAGYAGDIAPAHDGFVLSCQHAQRVLWWSARRPGALSMVATLREACALSPLAAFEGGVAVAGAIGVGRWHPARAAALLRWPEPIALDNHWVELASA